MNSRYVVLLRGVNVGGARRVPKLAFAEVLESIGCTDVVVYLNSGNAVCSSETPLTGSAVGKALEARFGFDVPTLVLPGEQVQRIAAAIPPGWTNDSPKPDKSGHKSDVIYLFDEVNNADILEQLGYKPEIETLRYLDGAVIATVSRKNQSRGSLQRIIGSGLYSKVTIRNVNTARKLAELV